MNKYLISALLLGASVAAHAQPAVMTVALSNFSFSPNAIQLRAGVPTTFASAKCVARRTQFLGAPILRCRKNRPQVRVVCP